MAVFEAFDEEDLLQVDTDKEWDALHRCLSKNGILDPDSGKYPLSHAVLGGRELLPGDEYWACHLTANEVKDVAKALTKVRKSWLRKQFKKIDPDDYDGQCDDEDFPDTWESFLEVREFFAEAAEGDHAVVFTADKQAAARPGGRRRRGR